MDGGVRSDGGGAGGCAAGEICVQGRCYARCMNADDCGPDETCSSSGAGTRGTRPDGGPMDGGTPSACDGVECTAPQVCHPATGTCVDCTEETLGAAPGSPGRCAGGAPICDIANGRCNAFAPTHCAACNSDADCNDGAGFAASCVLRETLGVRESVCLLPCDPTVGGCPGGLECTTITNVASGADESVCVPPIEMPCTNWIAGVNHRSCFGDTECAALGAVVSVYPDACEGEVIATDDGGVSTAGTCLLPCGATDDCFNAAGGEQCVGSGTALFCRIP